MRLPPDEICVVAFFFVNSDNGKAKDEDHASPVF
jgi:hypothetical protein